MTDRLTSGGRGAGQAPQPARHSGLGIASVVLAVLSWLCWLSMPVIARVAPTGGTPMDAIYFFPSGIVGAVSAAASILLGTACLFQRDRRKVLGWCGLVMSLAPAVPYLMDRLRANLF